MLHRENYVAWKSASKAASTDKSIENSLLREINTEANLWKKILERILNVILFLSERGLPLFGSSQRIGDRSNGNLPDIIELLGMYDPVLQDNVRKVRESQNNQKSMHNIMCPS